MSPLGPGARALLETASGGDEPTEADAGRVRAKLAARLGAAAMTGAVATATTKAAATTASTAAGAAGTVAGASADASAGAAASALGSTTAASSGPAGAAASALASTTAASGGPAGAAASALGSTVTTAGAGAAATAGTVSLGAKLLVAMALVGGSAATGTLAMRAEGPPSVATSPQPSLGENMTPAGREARAPAHIDDSAEELHAEPIPGDDAPTPLVAAEATPAPKAAPRGTSSSDRAAPRRRAVSLPSDDDPTKEEEASAASDGSGAHAGPALADATATESDAVAEEAALIRAANAALAHGDAVAALARLDEHDGRFPRGALAEERRATRVFALCAAGRVTEARALASAFVAASPRSPLASRVGHACSEGAKAAH